MKTQKSRKEGSTLLVVMMSTGIIVLSLGAYLALASTENRIEKRSLTWNAALPMAEAGIEEALSQLQQNTTNFAADGWGTNAAHFKQRSLGTNGYYSVKLEGRSGGTVTITSTGLVRFAGGAYISRTVQVEALTIVPFHFPGLMASTITFGGDFNADSYDSSSTNTSTLGLYDPRKASAEALIATTGSGYSVGGNSTIRGYVAAGPGGSVAVGGSATVGDMNYNKKGIQPGHSTNNFTMVNDSVQVPYTSGYPVSTNNVGGTNYDYVLTGGDFYSTNLGSTLYGSTMYVSDWSELYVTGPIDLSKIVFAPGAHLDLFVGGTSVTFAPVVVGAAAPDFNIFVLPTCTTLQLGSKTILTGLIYAPDTDLIAAGGAQISGAIVGKSFKCTGGFTFHYDLAFEKPRNVPPVKILSWAEL